MPRNHYEMGLKPETELSSKSPNSAPTPASVNPEPSKTVNMTPSLPPHMESIRSQTAEETVRKMARAPLFMTSLEDAQADDNDDENIELEAMRALKYEGTPVEIALGLKQDGNEAAKLKRWKEAKDLFTQALGVLRKSHQAPTTSAEFNETSKEAAQGKSQEEKSIEEACYVNRALCNLELKNYRSTTLDCAAALRLNPSNIKASYRSALALLALDKLREALDASTRGQTLDPTNLAFLTLVTKIETRSATLATISQQRAQTTSSRLKEQQTLTAALHARNIIVRTTPDPPSLEDATLHLSPDPLSPSSTLVFPLLLLYPLHAQSDFIKACPETSSLGEHLSYIFPLPWDEKGEYRLGNVELYVETGMEAGVGAEARTEAGTGKSKAALIKVGRKMPLLEIIGQGRVVVWDGAVKVNVLLKGKAADWIEEVKKRKGKGK